MDKRNGQESTADILLEAARKARQAQTPAEREVWEMVRAHRCGGFHFRRQCIRRPFRLDFYCAGLRLAIEVDGNVHDNPDVQRRDAARQEILEQAQDIHFLRLTNEQVLNHPRQVRQLILDTARALANRPSPIPMGEGGEPQRARRAPSPAEP